MINQSDPDTQLANQMYSSYYVILLLQIANQCGAYLMVDMAHISGLVAGQVMWCALFVNNINISTANSWPI